MGKDKSAEPLDVEVDELALSLVGWQVDEVQARLVTKTYGKNDYRQEVVVSGTVRFLPEDRSDKFTSSDYAPPPLLVFSRKGSNTPPTYERALFETEKKARKRPLRFSETSRRWECSEPLSPADLHLRLTAFDISEVDSNFELPTREGAEVEVNVIDDTTRAGVRARVSNVSAQIVPESYSKTLRVHMEGVFEFGTAQQLLDDYVADDDWRDETPTLEGECPFEVGVPEIEVEVLDGEGFLIATSGFQTYAHIRVQKGGKLPGRPPRWVAQDNLDVEDMSGKPTRVVVRIVDADE
ncbi:hypothetical protein [Rhodococcus sp. BUPNP1]|uniref:hypothetical protein n=1 Tax=Rhodococcus sp. BUPNP1 TaxID=1432786 RepID=UPI000B5A47B4|nr:hypothetical protein [Rhodococcus sp. BUPNP1]OWY83840.1 hypothetical protein B9C99_01750 [Rhodococcus sp. BUPNP1]